MHNVCHLVSTSICKNVLTRLEKGVEIFIMFTCHCECDICRCLGVTGPTFSQKCANTNACGYRDTIRKLKIQIKRVTESAKNMWMEKENAGVLKGGKKYDVDIALVMAFADQYAHHTERMTSLQCIVIHFRGNTLTGLHLVPHICVSELDYHWYM